MPPLPDPDHPPVQLLPPNWWREFLAWFAITLALLVPLSWWFWEPLLAVTDRVAGPVIDLILKVW